MTAATLPDVGERLRTVEFAIQDLLETDLLESASYALLAVDGLGAALQRYAQTRKETEDGNRVQSRGVDRQPGEESAGD